MKDIDGLGYDTRLLVLLDRVARSLEHIEKTLKDGLGR